MATTQFCLTNAGTNLIGPTVSLLSDLDNFTSEFQTGVSLSSLQPPNCPVTLTVPDNATVVKVYDPNSNACATVNLDGNDLCTLFNLAIDTYQSTTISQIIFGTFTTSFGPVNDYLIYWYRNGSSTPQYISGKGTLFAPYSFTHPLTGAGAILAQSGSYSIKIAKIQINGINFSTLDTPPAGFVKATASCIPTVFVQVSALNCSNGNFTTTDVSLAGYSHKFEYNNASVGTTPQSLAATFDLSDTTNYFAFAFAGYTVDDILKITFYGSLYPNPIVLENIACGSSNLGSSYIPNAVLKRYGSSDFFKKVLTLTGLNRSSQDYLTIEVIPNSINNQTIWTLYLKCLTTIDCTHCTDQFNNTPFKLLGSQTTSVTELTNGIDCGQVRVTTQMQACSAESLDNSDLFKYFGLGTSQVRASSGPPYIITRSVTANANIRDCQTTVPSTPGVPQICYSNPQGTITYTTVVNGSNLCITVTYSNSANFAVFLNKFTTILNDKRTENPNWSNPLSEDYWPIIFLNYPNGNGCGDQVPFNRIMMPLWLTYTSTVNSLTICYDSVPSSNLTNFLTANNISTCDLFCQDYFTSAFNRINNQISSLQTTPINFTNSSGGFYDTPFNFSNTVLPPVVPRGSLIGAGNMFMNVYRNVTYMMTQDGQLINTTPIKACDFESLGGWPININSNYAINQNLNSYVRDNPLYSVQARNPRNLTYPSDATILGVPRVNGLNVMSTVFAGQPAYEVAWQKFDGVVTTNNNYII
jgi:hypothetical protein